MPKKKIKDYNLQEIDKHLDVLIYAFAAVQRNADMLKNPFPLDVDHQFPEALLEMQKVLKSYDWDLEKLFNASADPHHLLPRNRPHWFSASFGIDVQAAQRNAEEAIKHVEKMYKENYMRLDK